MEFVFRQLTNLSVYVHCSNQNNIIARKKICIALSNVHQCDDVDNNEFIAGIFLLLSITKQKKIQKLEQVFIEVVFNPISKPNLSRRWIQWWFASTTLGVCAIAHSVLSHARQNLLINFGRPIKYPHPPIQLTSRIDVVPHKTSL